MNTKRDNTLNRIFRWLSRNSWKIISGIAVFLTVFEFSELLHKKEPLTDLYHWMELIIYFMILILVGVLVNFLVKANNAQDHTMEILKHKHNISTELTKLDDWDVLVNELVMLPSRIAAVEASQLQVYNPISSKLEVVKSQSETSDEKYYFHGDCEQYLKENANANSVFEPYTTDSDGIKEYCLPLNYGENLLAILQLKLKSGEQLSSNQKEIFESISPEIALALKASQEQKILSEMRMTEMALAERHSLSTYLHDHLSQNLAYLCLKLEQVTTEGETLSIEGWQSDFKHMKDAANQSYDIVRGKIETIHSETTPRLVNLLGEYAKKVSERSHIKISIEKTGNHLPISDDIQRAVFYVYQEAMTNVEKHAKAQNVDVLVSWGENDLTVAVKDDGVGFPVQAVKGTKHLGLEIMQERINKVNGRIDIRSFVNTGTEISIFVPCQAIPSGGNV